MRVKRKPKKSDAVDAVASSDVDVGPDEGRDFDTLAKDVIGEDGSDSEDEHDKRKKKSFGFGGDEEEDNSEKEAPCIFFDFRRGVTAWPQKAVRNNTILNCVFVYSFFAFRYHRNWWIPSRLKHY